MATAFNVDPSRTTMLRAQYQNEAVKRFNALGRAIRQWVGTEDSLALAQPENPMKGITANDAADRERFRFETASAKVKGFQTWLQREVDDKVLESTAGAGKAPWHGKYIESAYKKGNVRAYLDSKAGAGAPSDAFYEGGKAGFLSAAFNAPETVDKLKLLKTRNFEHLKDITSTMSNRMGNVLAGGIAAGKHPLDVAKELEKEVGITAQRARVIARTEIIHAHAEGQLDSFEKLGVEEVGVLAEWKTAGDAKVCALCSSLSGVILTIKEARGLIPRHPNCRCTWTPANVGEKRTPDQKYKKEEIQAAFDKSIKEGGKVGDTLEEKRKKTTWPGADSEPVDKEQFTQEGRLAAVRAKRAAAAEAKNAPVAAPTPKPSPKPAPVPESPPKRKPAPKKAAPPAPAPVEKPLAPPPKPTTVRVAPTAGADPLEAPVVEFAPTPPSAIPKLRPAEKIPAPPVVKTVQPPTATPIPTPATAPAIKTLEEAHISFDAALTRLVDTWEQAGLSKKAIAKLVSQMRRQASAARKAAAAKIAKDAAE